MRPYLLISILATLVFIDASSTLYLFTNMPGEELNPYVEPSSMTSLLFAPMLIVVYILFLAAVVYTELNAHKAMQLADRRSPLMMIFIFPLFFLFFKALACINNIIGIVTCQTPVSYIMQALEWFSEDKGLRVQLFATLLVFAFLPLGFKLVRLLYRNDGDGAASETQ